MKRAEAIPLKSRFSLHVKRERVRGGDKLGKFGKREIGYRWVSLVARARGSVATDASAEYLSCAGRNAATGMRACRRAFPGRERDLMLLTLICPALLCSVVLCCALLCSACARDEVAVGVGVGVDACEAFGRAKLGWAMKGRCCPFLSLSPYLSLSLSQVQRLQRSLSLA